MSYFMALTCREVKNVMSMSKRIGVALVSIIFLVALVSAVPVEAKKGFSVYRWWSETNYNFDPEFTYEWKGDIWAGEKGEGEHGTIYWDNFGAIWLGPAGDKVQKFWGVWWIEWDSGEHIEGTHEGSFTYAIMQCTINGRITVTSDDWSYLDGRKIHTVNYVDFANFHIEHYLQIN
jgi:hypothetical protein